MKTVEEVNQELGKWLLSENDKRKASEILRSFAESVREECAKRVEGVASDVNALQIGLEFSRAIRSIEIK